MAHPLYMVWWNMKQRCENPARDDYQYYGAKGITVCPEWNEFSRFYGEMRDGWKPGLRLDREDGTKGYMKSNCRWVDASQSQFNRGTFSNNHSGLSGVGQSRKGWRARAGKGGAEVLYNGPDFFEACCARKSFDAVKRGSV